MAKIFVIFWIILFFISNIIAEYDQEKMYSRQRRMDKVMEAIEIAKELGWEFNISIPVKQ